MALLETLLAFALTMLVCATIASIIVETILRFLKRREKDYDTMLRNLFEDVVWPRFEAQLKGKYVDVASAAKTFALAMQKNPGVEPPGITRNGGNPADSTQPSGDVAKKPGAQGTEGSALYAERHAVAYKEQQTEVGIWRRILNWLIPRELTSITPMQFAERLAGTEVGKEIYAQGQAMAGTIVKDLAQKLDNVGKAAGEYYARRARTICMGVSIVVAFALNIDGYKVFTTFLAEEQVRRAVIAEKENIEGRYQDARTKLEQAEKALIDQRKADAAKPSDPAKPGESPNTGEAPKPADAGDKQNALKKAHDEAKAQYEKIHNQMVALTSTGTPVGHDYFPYCRNSERDIRCHSVPARTWLHDAGNGIAWFFAVLITGFLIGLGGPFWYDLVQSLSRVLQLARGLGLGKAKEEDAATARGPAADTGQPKNPVEAFRTAAEAAYSATPGATRGRGVLDASGNEHR